MTKYLGWIVLAVIAVAYIIISATRGQWNPGDWFKDKLPDHTPGSGCTTNDNKQGIYDANGICVATGGSGPTEPDTRMIISPGWTWLGRRRMKCYPKPAGASCVYRRFEPTLGWGTLYSQTSTSCCYLF